MSEAESEGRGRSLVRRWWWVMGVVVLAAITGLALMAWNANRVSWVKVREAYGKQKTINGVGRGIDAQGRVWQVALWVQVVSPTKFAPNWVLLPPKEAPYTKLERDLLGLTNALDYTGGLNYVSALAASRRWARGKPTEWGGKPALEITLPMPLDLIKKRGTYPMTTTPDRLRFYVDPETKLIQGLEVFKDGKLRASAEYTYNKPLPQGFRPQ